MISRGRYTCKADANLSGTIFIKDVVYDIDYEEWWFEDGFKLNGSHRRYWYFTDNGEKNELSKSIMKIIFDTKSESTQYYREVKINEILNNK